MSYPAGQDDAGQGSLGPPQPPAGSGQPSDPYGGYPQQPYPQNAYSQPEHPQPYQHPGYPQPPYPYPGQVVVASAPGNGLGVAGFVTGLLGLIFFWVPFLGLVLGLLGVILGGAGISSGKRSGAGTGLAVAGLVLGIISLIPAIIVIAALSST